MSKNRRGKHSHATPVVGAGTLSRAERYAKGKALRSHVPREQHGKWTPSPHRRNPADLVMESSEGRIPELVPIRNGRMLRSPFTFYRGAASVMAADLAYDAGHRNPRADLRRLPPAQSGLLRDARAPLDRRHQRFRRDVAGPVGVGRQATCGQFRSRVPVERVFERRPTRRRARMRAFVSKMDGAICRHASARRVVCKHRHHDGAGAIPRRSVGRPHAQTTRQGRDADGG